MSISITSIPAGIMVSATVQTETDKLSSYLRGGAVDADVSNNSLARRHLFKPEVLGFPMEESRSPLQLAYSHHSPPDDQDWRDKRHRCIIFPQFLTENDDWPLWSLCKTIRVNADTRMRVCVWMSGIEIRDPTALGGDIYGPTYDDGYVAGSFVVKYRAHSDASITTIPSMRHQVDNNHGTLVGGTALVNAYSYRRINMRGIIDFPTAGTYDVYVAYERDGSGIGGLEASANTYEVVVGNSGLLLEGSYT